MLTSRVPRARFDNADLAALIAAIPPSARGGEVDDRMWDQAAAERRAKTALDLARRPHLIQESTP